MKRLILALCAVCLISGCAGMQLTDNDPRRAYLVALEQYIVMGEMYMEHWYRLTPDDAAHIKELLIQADMALDAWKMALLMNEQGSTGQLDALAILEKLAILLPRALEAIE